MSVEKCKQQTTTSATTTSNSILSSNSSLTSNVHVDSSSAQLKADPMRIKQEKMERRICRSSKNHRAAPYNRATNGSGANGKTSPTAKNVIGGCSSDESANEVSQDEVAPDQKKEKRVSANKRERSRMHTVNEAFDSLRELVPTYPSNRKLSKIETLRLACSYIEDLAKLLHESPPVHAQGDDVALYHKNFSAFPPYHHGMDGTAAAHHLYPAMMKSEYVSQDYSPCYQHYRVPYTAAGSDCESCNSEPDVPSSPYSVHAGSPGIAVRPLAVARVSSDSGVAMQMATASLSGTSSPIYNNSIPAPYSPLTKVHHSTPPNLSHSHQTSIFTPAHVTMAPIASWQRTAHFAPSACCYSQ